jgi:putative heme-binding domain-containing protein
VLDAAAPIDRRIDAALAMANDPGGGLLLIQLAAENTIAYQLREAIGSVIFSNPDRSVRAAAAGFFPRPGGQPRMTVTDVTSRAGDASRGQMLYLTSCSTCHPSTPLGTGPSTSLGVGIGPDLTDINKKFDLAGVVEAIVNPSAAVALGFGAELFVTRRNEPHIGFLQADGATVSIRDGYGRVHTLAREDLAARIPLKTSLMPEPLALALTEQDVADIAAFLMKPVGR